MANVQIAIIDQENTQIALAAPSEAQVNIAVPGIQGPVGQGVPNGGAANQVLFKQSGTDYDTAWSEITSDMIGDLEIVDADVSASAAIAGTKISPDFGSQAVVTTGTSTAASFIPTGSTVPTNGIYTPSANQLALSTGGTGRLFVDANGNVSVGTATSKTALVGGTANGVTIGDTEAPCLILWDTSDSSYGTYIAQVQTESYFYNYANGPLILGTNNDERARITSDGKLGLGTSSPYQELTLRGTNEQLLFDLNTITNGVYGSLAWNGSASDQGTGNYSAEIRGYREAAGAYGALGFHTRGVSGSSVERVRIDSSGRVGLGTSSPGNLLELKQNSPAFRQTSVSESGGYTATFGLAYNPNTTFSIAANATGQSPVQIFNWGSNGNLALNYSSTLATRAFIVNDGATERLRIDSSGRLLVGTSSSSSQSLLIVQGRAGSNTSYAQMELQRGETGLGVSTNLGRIYFADSNGGTGAELLAATDAAWSGSSYPTRLVFSTTAAGAASPTERMRITSDGKLGLGTGSPQVTAQFSSSGAGGNPSLGSATGITYVTTSNTAFGMQFGVNGSTGVGWIQQGRTDGTATAYNLLLNPVGGNVGIGTTGPSYILDIKSADGIRLRDADDLRFLRLIPATGVSGGNAAAKINNSSANGLTIETAGSIAFADNTGANERARIDSSGRLLIGTSTARANFFNTVVSPYFQLEGSGDFNRQAAIISSSSTGSFGGVLTLAHQKSGTVGGNTLVADGDRLGQISFQGNDGTQFVLGAQIQCEVDGTPGANDMPGRLVFSTNGGSPNTSPTERMRITSDAYVRLASGTGGIQFNGDTAAANALDDYEEGSWTPVFKGSTTDPTITYGSIRSGQYTKIGRSVFITCLLQIGVGGITSVGSGNLSVGGLPFTGAGTARFTFTVGWANALNLGAGVRTVATIDGDGGNIRIYSYNEDTGAITWLATSVLTVPGGGQSYLNLSGHYHV